MQRRKSQAGHRRPVDLEGSTTEEVLRIYERVIGPLTAQSKRRIVKTARLHGWDRSWTDREPAGV